MSRWNITENVIAEIGNQISSVMALYQNIDEIHMAVLDITWVPRHRSLHISITGDVVRARVAAFL